MFRRAELEPLPAAVSLLLAATIGLQLAVRPVTVVPPVVAAPLPRIVTATAIPVPDYPAIAARPVFSPSRRGGDDGSAATVIGDFALLGTARAGGIATALFRGPGGGVLNLRSGGMVAGWRLAGIGRGRALLIKGGASVTMTAGSVSPGPQVESTSP